MGDKVHASGCVRVRGTWFGEIVEYQEADTEIYDGTTLSDDVTWLGERVFGVRAGHA